MKILILVDSWPNEKNSLAGIFYKDQADALNNNEVKIDVIVIRYYSLKFFFKKNKGNGKIITNMNYDIQSLEFPNLFPKVKKNKILLFQNYFHVKKLFKRINVNKYDLVHSHNLIWMGLTVALIKKNQNKRLKLVVTEHSSKFSMGDITNSQIKTIKKLSKYIDKILAVGFGLKQNLSSFIEYQKLMQLNNMININDYYISNLAGDEFIFKSLGNLENHKGFDILIRAFSELEVKNTKLIIAGGGKELKNLKKLIQNLNIDDKVKLIGPINRNEVPQFLSECHAFVLLSRHETFGLVYAEALASGLPIIASKTGGPDHFINNHNGIMVNINDIQQSSKALNKMINDYHKYDKKTIKKNTYIFDSSYISSKIKELYLEILFTENNS